MFNSPPIHRTPRYRAKAAFANMKRRCKGGVACEPAYADVELRMALEEWLRWAVPRYKRFVRRHPDERPSAARRGDVGHYEIGNIEIISMTANRARQKAIRVARRGRKSCGRCDKTKSVAEFHRNRSKPDGLDYWCRSCRAIYLASVA